MLNVLPKCRLIQGKQSISLLKEYCRCPLKAYLVPSRPIFTPRQCNYHPSKPDRPAHKENMPRNPSPNKNCPHCLIPRPRTLSSCSIPVIDLLHRTIQTLATLTPKEHKNSSTQQSPPQTFSNACSCQTPRLSRHLPLALCGAQHAGRA